MAPQGCGSGWTWRWGAEPATTSLSSRSPTQAQDGALHPPRGQRPCYQERSPEAPHPLVELPVESHAQQVHGVLGGAVGLLAAAVLEILQAEVGLPGIAGRRPDKPGRAVAAAEQRFQLPDLHEEGGGNCWGPPG